MFKINPPGVIGPPNVIGMFKIDSRRVTTFGESILNISFHMLFVFSMLLKGPDPSKALKKQTTSETNSKFQFIKQNLAAREFHRLILFVSRGPDPARIWTPQKHSKNK